MRNFTITKIKTFFYLNSCFPTTPVKRTSNPSKKISQNPINLIEHLKLLIVTFNKPNFLKSVGS